MGRRLCEVPVLKAAINKSGFPHLFGSALLRHGRGERLFAIVGNDNGPQAVVYDVIGIQPEKITLSKPRILHQPKITNWFDKAAVKKSGCEQVETTDCKTYTSAFDSVILDERLLRSFASQEFPGSLFYDVFIDVADHVFNALPPIGIEKKKLEEQTLGTPKASLPVEVSFASPVTITP